MLTPCVDTVVVAELTVVTLVVVTTGKGHDIKKRYLRSVYRIPSSLKHAKISSCILKLSPVVIGVTGVIITELAYVPFGNVTMGITDRSEVDAVCTVFTLRVIFTNLML